MPRGHLRRPDARVAGWPVMGDEIGQPVGFYYNLRTGKVEREGQSKAKDLLGPFPTAEEAANALEIIREREQHKQAEDRAWRERGTR